MTFPRRIHRIAQYRSCCLPGTAFKKTSDSMKIILLLILLCDAYASADWKEKSRQMEETSIKTRETCASKLGLTEKEVKLVDTMQTLPTTKREKCIMECILTEMGLMENGRFSRQGVDKFSEFLYDDDPPYLSMALAATRRCEKQLARLKLNDGCEEAVVALRCLAKITKQLHLKSGIEDDKEYPM